MKLKLAFPASETENYKPQILASIQEAYKVGLFGSEDLEQRNS